MIYNGFVVLDTHDTPMEMMAGGDSNYDTPALPGGGTTPSGGTAPLIPGWSVTGGGAISGGSPSSTSTGTKVNWGGILDKAPTVLGTLGQVAGTVNEIRGSRGASASGDPITMACGKRPLLLPGKKRAWDQCAASVVAAQQAAANQRQQEEGLSTTAKVLIGVGILVFLIIVVVLIIMISKNKNK
jgi:hypothetical protein